LLAAVVCSLLVLTETVSWSVHVLAHHHDDAKHCHRTGGSAHLHSPEYAHHPCALCDFTIPLAMEMPGVYTWYIAATPVLHAPQPLWYAAPVVKAAFVLPALRGPPMV
jgi:hypothetical protein